MQSSVQRNFMGKEVIKKGEGKAGDQKVKAL